jgi:hypothetical protein
VRRRILYCINGGAILFMAYVWYYVAMYGGIYLYERSFWIRWFEFMLLLFLATTPKR